MRGSTAGLPSPQTTLLLQGWAIAVVSSFTYLGSCNSSNSRVSEDKSARTAKAKTTSVNLRQFRRQKGVPPHLNGRVHNAIVQAVLQYAGET